MAESAANTYATNSSNQAANAPNPVAVVNDGTGDRQIVVLGAGDGTTNLNDGSSAHPLNVEVANLPTTQPVSGTVAVSNLPATQPVSATALPLPTGAATSANQSTEISSLSTIATDTGKIPAQGAALTAASTPVNIASDQTVPVSASSLPLPSGAATSANQSTEISSLSSIATDVAPLTSSSAGGYVRQDSNATIAKESGGNLAGAKADLDTIAGTVSGGKVLTTETNSAGITTNTGLAATNTTGLNNTVGTAGSAIPTKGVVVQGSDGTDARALKTDTSGNLDVNVQGTVPVSGTFYQTTQPVSLATNTPTLQSGSTTAVTQPTASNLNATVVGTGTFAVQDSTTETNTGTIATNQTSGSQKTRIVDGSGNVIGSTSNALNVAITSGGGSGGTSSSYGSAFPSTGTAVGASNGTNMEPLNVDGSGYLEVNVETSALPTGAATAANQTAGNSSLSTIATNTGSSATAANQTNGNQQAKLTDGTNVANVVAGDTGFNGVATASAGNSITFTSSGTGAQILGPWKVEGFSHIAVHITSNTTGGLAWGGQFSQTSGGTYSNTQTFLAQNSPTPAAAEIGTTNGQYYSTEVVDNYFQLNINALTSGTISGTITLSNRAPGANVVSAASVQYGTWTVGLAANQTIALSQGTEAQQTGTITSSSSSIITGAAQGYTGFASVSIYGTYSGVSFGITQSDNAGTQYYNVPIYDQAAMQWLAPGSTITPGTNTSKVYFVPTYGSSKIKVLASAYSSGTANVTITQSVLPTSVSSTMSQIMDSAGNARGANVDANGNLNTHDESSGATGSAVPANAFAIGLKGASGNLVSAFSVNGASRAATSGDNVAAVGGYMWNGTNFDVMFNANTVANTTGTGLLGTGVLAYDGTNWQYVGIDASHNLNVNVEAGTVGTTSAVVNVGQMTVSTSAVQVISTSTVPTNGIVIRALSTNSASIFVGGSGVTTSTGYELVAGESISFTCNLNTLYIISPSSTTDKICWNVE